MPIPRRTKTADAPAKTAATVTELPAKRPAKTAAKRPAKTAAAPKTAPAGDVQRITIAAETGAADATYFASLPIAQIKPSPANPRETLRDLDELRDSIAEHGIYEPLVVALADGYSLDDERPIFDLIMGHRRLAAADAAGLTGVPAIERPDLRTDRRARVGRLVENLQRSDLTPLEEARGIRELVDDGMKQKDVAVAISRHPAHVTKRLQLLTLPEKAQALVASGAISVEVAVDLAKLPTAEQVKLVDQHAHALGGLPAAIARVRDTVESAKAREKVAAELRKGGLYVFVESTYPTSNLEDGPYDLASLRNLPAFDVPEDHRNAPCHIAIVSPYGARRSLSAQELEDDPLAAHYYLACSDPQSHRIKTETGEPAVPDELASSGGAASDPAWRAEQEARKAEVEARRAAVESLLADRWAHTVRLAGAKVTRANQGARLEHTLRVSQFDLLTRYEGDTAIWATAAALLAGDTTPPETDYGRNYSTGDGQTDLPGIRTALDAIYAGGADLERHAYATALATGYEALRYCLTYARHSASAQSSLAALHLRHLIDDNGGGLPVDEVEQAIALESSDLAETLRDLELLAPLTVTDVNLPEHPDDATGEPDEDDPVVDDVLADAELARDASSRRKEIGVTDGAEADYVVRIGGGSAYLVPGIKTAKGQCASCHAQTTIRSGGVAGKHSTVDGPCPGTGQPVMTLDQAMPAEPTDDAPADTVDQVACPTCEGVGRDASDQLCATCAGRGLVAPELASA